MPDEPLRNTVHRIIYDEMCLAVPSTDNLRGLAALLDDAMLQAHIHDTFEFAAPPTRSGPSPPTASAASSRSASAERHASHRFPQILRMMTIEGLFVATAGTALGTLIAVATLIPFNIAAAVPA